MGKLRYFERREKRGEQDKRGRGEGRGDRGQESKENEGLTIPLSQNQYIMLSHWYNNT
jgi:hypothetical protein